jgi:hypothetical protein
MKKVMIFAVSLLFLSSMSLLACDSCAAHAKDKKHECKTEECKKKCATPKHECKTDECKKKCAEKATKKAAMDCESCDKK